jgi:GGDEF domain-containing protein
LLKPSKLTETEFALIKEHVTAGYKILANIPMYKHLADIVYAHHERYDGQGYPRGLKGEQIPLLSRIMTIADSFDAMTTQRIYKAKKSISNTIKELVELSGTWFDPEIIKHAVSVLSNMDVDKYIQQIPATQIDDQRFAYFYKDPLTSLYNHFYLDFLLQNNKESHVYMYLSIIYIKSFTAYNKKHGWSEGDILLGSFSNYLQNKFSALKIFRIFGDDFVLLHNEEINIKIDEINALPLLKNNNIQCGSKQYNLKEVTINGYKDLQE